MYPNEMMIGFNILLFNTEFRKTDPIVACEKIKNGTDIRFVCFDRLETEGEFSYIHFSEKMRATQELLDTEMREVNGMVS